MDQSGDRALRAKYLDWCSARLAERFLDMAPEEIYELARPERVGEAGEPGGGAGLPSPMDESYRSLVQRVTESLLVRMPLPTYEQWAAAYEESPERFEAELLGFWRDVAGEDAVVGEDAEGNGGSSARPD